MYLQKKDKKSLMNRDWNSIITEYQNIIIADAVAKSYDVRITKASKNSKQNSSVTVTNENDK